GAVDGVRAGNAVHVCDAEVVPLHRATGARAVGALDVCGLRAEGRVLVEVRDLRARQAGRVVDQVLVHRELVGRMGRVDVVELELGEVGAAEGPVGAAG